MRKYFFSHSKLITIYSPLFSVVIVFLLRQTNPGGDLFSQINLSVFCGFAFGFFVIFARKKSGLEKGIKRHLHSLLTVQLIIFISLQFSLVNIDRSRSFYVLSWANQEKVFDSKQGITLVGVQSPEILNLSAIRFRLDEQIKKNLLKVERGQIKPTLPGKFMILIADGLANLFNLENWKLNKK